jgi:hypothetical protein
MTKKLGFFGVLLLVGVSAWSLNVRSIADRALSYLGNPLPANAEKIENTPEPGGRIRVINEDGHRESFVLSRWVMMETFIPYFILSMTKTGKRQTMLWRSYRH